MYLAEHDANTGLMNRRSFLDHLARSVARTPSEASRSALFLADISDFKRINHALGWDAGDRLLAAFGRALQDFTVRGCAARLGGDDFACLLPGIGSVELARGAAHELQRQVTAGIIQLGHSLGMEVVAEGVETPDQLRLLRAQRCDMAQGFGLQRPLAPGVLDLEPRDMNAAEQRS